MLQDGLVEFDSVLAIARRGSFRAAALELGLSTTALSNAIAKLERQLGIRLFNRTTRSVALTDAGRKFVDQVGPAIRDIHDAMDTARSQQETPSGTLRINAFPTAAREILEPLLLQFLRRYPQVHVDLVTEGRIVDIVADGFDLGLRSADLVPGDMIAIPVGPPRSFAVVASPAYFKANEKPRIPPDLLHHACLRIRLPNGALHRWQFEKDASLSRSTCTARSHSMRPVSRASRCWTVSASATSWSPIYGKTSRQGGSFAFWKIGPRR